jgi:membrane-associated phospholipid phosphatase
MRKLHKICILIFLLSPICSIAAKESKVSPVKNIGTTISEDYLKFYSLRNLKYLLGGMCIAGLSANTNADRDIQDWFQENVRNKNTDRFSKIAKPIGNIYEPISIYAGFTLLGSLTRHTTMGATAYEWGSKSLRAIIVGAPAVGVLQYVLGASRPYEGSSRWHPFHDTNSVSGHAFLGAIPFLTISKMVKPKYFKLFFYVSSFSTGLSRINDNKHYLSQVALGWWIAYLSTKSVDISKKRKIDLEPSYSCDGWKIMLCFSL